VLSLGAGINQLDPAGLPRGVPVARLIDGSLTRTMVEYARATIFRYHKRLDLYERLTRKAEWRFMPPVSSGDTSIGILGLGVIGRAIADALAADGFAVHGWSRGAKPSGALKTYAGPDGLAELLPQVDILVNVLPLTAETRFILNRDMFSRVRPGTRLINIGRGAHLVEQDLVDAMQAGQIGGATLDVHSVEPLPPDHVFWTTPGILITPHVAGMSLPAEASANVAENIRRALAGVELLNQVDFTRGY
jgi:glyoxylate/hydroxypyruvate reductase A